MLVYIVSLLLSKVVWCVQKDGVMVVNALVAFARNLPSVDDVRAIGDFIFRKETDPEAKARLVARFIRSVNYYDNATAHHFHQHFKANCNSFTLVTKHQ